MDFDNYRKGMDDNQALNHLVGLGPTKRLAAGGTATKANAFAVVAINGDVTLGAATDAEGFTSGDILLEGVTYHGRFTDIEIGVGGGDLIYYPMSTTSEFKLAD